jgi:hypothetical protein
MSSRVSELDARQRASMAAHAEAWADRALCTDPVDWAKWEAGVRACYQYAGVRWPGEVVRAASPLAMARALFQARVRETPGDEDRALVGVMRRAMQDRVVHALSRRFDPRVTAVVQRGVFLPVDSAVAGVAIAQAVDEQLYGHPLEGDPIGTRDSALASARRLALATHADQHSPALRRRVPPEWRSWTLHLGGRWEAAWSAYASFFESVRQDQDKGWRRRIQAFSAAQSAGWWWPHLDYVLVCDPPVVVQAERLAGQPARLHCADGPAVAWRDGWRLHFWHGTRVPAWVIERPTVEAVHAEPNVEVRRCGIEALGWDTYIDEAGLRLVDQRADPGNPGCDLELYDLPDRVWGMPTRVLLAVNGSVERDGTRRRYGLPVPGGLETAVHAAAWTYGLTGDQYARLARRT